MKSDLVILVPMTQNGGEGIDEEWFFKSDIFIEQMDGILKYEVFDDMYRKISRCFLGSHELIFYKNWPEYHIEELPTLKGNIYLAIEKTTNICICEIVVNLESDEYLTFYLDAIPKDDVFIKDLTHGNVIKLNEYLKQFGCVQIATPKSCVYLSEMPSARELTYILASEFYIVDDEAFIESKNLESKLSCNLSQYDFLKCYATINNAVNIMRIFHEDYSERLYYEGMSIFLVELILFQIAAITRTNNRVVSLLSSGEIPSLEIIKSIDLQYAQTMTFWNINIFRSTTAQIAANQMYHAFEVPSLVEQYERNQKMMENIISIKNQIEDAKHTDQQEKENNILGVLATFSILSALVDGFSAIDFFVGFEKTLEQIHELEFINILSILLKMGLFVCIMLISMPALSIIIKNCLKKKKK